MWDAGNQYTEHRTRLLLHLTLSLELFVGYQLSTSKRTQRQPTCVYGCVRSCSHLHLYLPLLLLLRAFWRSGLVLV